MGSAYGSSQGGSVLFQLLFLIRLLQHHSLILRSLVCGHDVTADNTLLTSKLLVQLIPLLVLSIFTRCPSTLNGIATMTGRDNGAADDSDQRSRSIDACSQASVAVCTYFALNFSVARTAKCASLPSLVLRVWSRQGARTLPDGSRAGVLG